MSTSYYLKDMSYSAVDQYNGYTPHYDTSSSFLDLALNGNKLQVYPTPEKSPLSNESLVISPGNMSINNQQSYLDSMMMVPPLAQFNYFESSYENNLTYMAPEHKGIDIDLVDKFIAEHEAALNVSETKKNIKDVSWSHWTFVRETSPEVLSEGLSSSKSTTNSSVSSSPLTDTIEMNKQSHKVVKPRRGRGKGVKNKTKKITEKQTKQSMTEGALFVCQHDNCGKSFTRPYNLTSHMRTHSSERPYACSHCDRRFARQHDRNRHEKLHWGIRPYACHHCHKAFARMDALNRHLRMENGCTLHL